jgi:hypothetical protein
LSDIIRIAIKRSREKQKASGTWFGNKYNSPQRKKPDGPTIIDSPYGFTKPAKITGHP